VIYNLRLVNNQFPTVDRGLALTFVDERLDVFVGYPCFIRLALKTFLLATVFKVLIS
jgi:hypothetical protein